MTAMGVAGPDATSAQWATDILDDLRRRDT
jgi:hypothetical protein